MPRDIKPRHETQYKIQWTPILNSDLVTLSVFANVAGIDLSTPSIRSCFYVAVNLQNTHAVYIVYIGPIPQFININMLRQVGQAFAAVMQTARPTVNFVLFNAHLQRHLQTIVDQSLFSFLTYQSFVHGNTSLIKIDAQTKWPTAADSTQSSIKEQHVVKRNIIMLQNSAFTIGCRTCHTSNTQNYIDTGSNIKSTENNAQWKKCLLHLSCLYI